MNRVGIICFFWLMLFSAPSSYAQFQENNWIYGFGNEVNFSGGNPSIGPANEFYATEGSATISTPDGQLQFYTDGARVFDRFGNLMVGENNLYGSDSSTQNALIIPFPGDSENRWYYIFTVPAQVNFYQNFSHSGLEYVVVDMAANGGLGSVAQASQELLPMIEEKIHATWHSNNRDVWLVVHGAEDDAFYSFLINCDGIQNPVISNTGQGRTQGLDFGSARGTLKLSPNSERIAIAHTNLTDEGFLNEAVIEVGMFNATSGEIEIQHEKVLGPDFMHESYSCEFSPNSDVLYWSILGGGPLRQFDLQAADFADSMIEIGEAFGEFWASITLGPNGKIYGARSNGNHFLASIEFPDVVGVGCTPNLETLELNALNSLGISNCWMYPFPEQVFPEDEVIEDEFCEGETLQLSAEVLIGNFLWSTGSTEPTETISEAGFYWVQIDDGCTQAQRSFEIEEIEKPALQVEQNEPFVCEGDTIFVSVQTDAEQWEWDGGGTQSDTLFTTATETFISVFEAACIWQDNVSIVFQEQPVLAVDSAYTFCEKTTFKLQLQPTEGTVLNWSDGETDWVFESDVEGTHWVEKTNSCGTQRIDFELSEILCDCRVFVPNAFTPDLNDLNETFRPVAECEFTDYSFTIFNRWGEVVFTTTQPEEAWNGNVNGGTHYAIEGVYAYVLRYGLPNGVREEVFGSVLLLR